MTEHRRRESFPEEIAAIVKRGGIGVMPTDTIYGVLASARSPRVVRRVYALRKRNTKKPMIILIAALRDLQEFGVRVKSYHRRAFKKYWPGTVSIILPCGLTKFAYLHCGTNTLAFRLPKDPALRALLRVTGPLVAPSANPEGKPPARTMRAAENYFGDAVDFYVDVGRRAGAPSKLITFDEENVVRLR